MKIGANHPVEIAFVSIAVLLVACAAVARTFFQPAPSHRINDNVYAIRCLFVNFYAVNTRVGVVLFDAGPNSRLAAFGLGSVGIAATAVTHIFLTHSDSDHAGGIAAFPNATVYISEAEVQMIDGTTPRFKRAGLRSSHNKPLDNYEPLRNGQVMHVGGSRIQTLVTPGHTPGSTTYLVNGSYLVTGDLLRMSKRGEVSPFFKALNMDHEKSMKSLKDVLPIAEASDFILSGHTGAYKILPSDRGRHFNSGRHFR